MVKYIVWVRQGDCIKKGNNWFQENWYNYEPEKYHEYSSYKKARKAFEKIDLTKYHLSNKRKFLFKEVVEPEYDEDRGTTEYIAINYKERFYQDWIDG